jgi:starch phosphorylase
MELHLDVDLGGLNPADVVVELLLEREYEALQRSPDSYRFLPAGLSDQGQEHFMLSLTPDLCGSLRYQIRTFPYHTLLTHPYEMGLMRWL